MTTSPSDILDKYSLRQTTCRANVLDIFLEHSGQGLSENFIEENIDGEFDRATIYRTLNTFIDKGIVHKIFDEDNIVKFALCTDDCDDGDHNHEHIHFKCTRCNTTSCLDEVSAVNVQLPEGYTKVEANYLIIGICATCNSKVGM